jgi:hypothetical protein
VVDAITIIFIIFTTAHAMLVLLALFIFVTCSLGESIHVPGYQSLNKRVTPLLEKCPQNPATNTAYHISLIGLHQHKNGGPNATECGPPGGSPHINLHFDQCKDINCNGCNFPFVTYNQYKNLERQYLIPINNWHAFIYKSSDGKECVCLWDSRSRVKWSQCFNKTPDINDIKDVLLTYVENIQQAAEDIWLELVDLPWQFKVLVMAVVLGAFVALFSEFIAALAAAGIVIAADVLADVTAVLLTGLAAKFGIPVP